VEHCGVDSRERKRELTYWSIGTIEFLNFSVYIWIYIKLFILSVVILCGGNFAGGR
jgi:hypothetical protein